MLLGTYRRQGQINYYYVLMQTMLLMHLYTYVYIYTYILMQVCYKSR